MVPRPEALDVYLRLVTFPWVSCMLYSVCWKDIRPINLQTFQQTLRAPDPLSLCFSSSVLPQSSVAWARDGDCLEEVSRKSKRLICLEHSKTFKFLLHLMCPLVGWYELETSDVTHQKFISSSSLWKQGLNATRPQPKISQYHCKRKPSLKPIPLAFFLPLHLVDEQEKIHVSHQCMVLD